MRSSWSGLRYRQPPTLKGERMEQVVHALADLENCDDVASIGALLHK